MLIIALSSHSWVAKKIKHILYFGPSGCSFPPSKGCRSCISKNGGAMVKGVLWEWYGGPRGPMSFGGENPHWKLEVGRWFFQISNWVMFRWTPRENFQGCIPWWWQGHCLCAPSVWQHRHLVCHHPAVSKRYQMPQGQPTLESPGV